MTNFWIKLFPWRLLLLRSKHPLQNSKTKFRVRIRIEARLWINFQNNLAHVKTIRISGNRQRMPQFLGNFSPHSFSTTKNRDYQSSCLFFSGNFKKLKQFNLYENLPLPFTPSLLSSRSRKPVHINPQNNSLFRRINKSNFRARKISFRVLESYNAFSTLFPLVSSFRK